MTTSPPKDIPDPLIVGPAFPDLRLRMHNGRQIVESRSNENLTIDRFDQTGTYTMGQFLHDLSDLCACPDEQSWCKLVYEEREEHDDYYGHGLAHAERERLDTRSCPSCMTALDLCQTETQRRFFDLWCQEWGAPSGGERAYWPIATQPENAQLLFQRLAFPALIPEVWLNYLGPRKSSSDERHLAENPSRVDFVMFRGGRKCVIEIDGPSHYADYDEANRRYLVSEQRYTRNLRIERTLRRNGWDIFRFSDLEIRETRPEDFRALSSHVYRG